MNHEERTQFENYDVVIHRLIQNYQSLMDGLESPLAAIERSYASNREKDEVDYIH